MSSSSSFPSCSSSESTLQSSPSLFPVVYDLSEFEELTKSQSISLSSDSSTLSRDAFSHAISHNERHSLDFSFADLAVPFPEIIQNVLASKKGVHSYSSSDLPERQSFMKIEDDSLVRKSGSDSWVEEKILDPIDVHNDQRKIAGKSLDVPAEVGSIIVNEETTKTAGYGDQNEPGDLCLLHGRIRKNLTRSIFPKLLSRRFLGHRNRSRKDCAPTENGHAFVFKDWFSLKRKVVQGWKSTLWECECKETGKLYLAKIFRVDCPEDKTRIQRELDIFKFIQEKLCCRSRTFPLQLEKVFYEESKIHLVLAINFSGFNRADSSVEIVTLDAIVLREGCLDEHTVQQLVRNLLSQLNILHCLGVSCNQILPSTIITGYDFKRKQFGGGNPVVMLVDFGLASVHEKKKSSKTESGIDENSLRYHHSVKVETVQKRSAGSATDGRPSVYMAPELIRRSCFTSIPSSCPRHPDEISSTNDSSDIFDSVGSNTWDIADIWSVGALVHYCLFGNSHPNPTVHMQACEDLQSVDYDYHSLRFKQNDHGHKLTNNHFSASSCGDDATSIHSVSGRKVQGEVDDDKIPLNLVSRSARQFISSCLLHDPTIRMTILEAFNHPWQTVPSRHYRTVHNKKLAFWPNRAWLTSLCRDHPKVGSRDNFPKQDSSGKRNSSLRRRSTFDIMKIEHVHI